MQMKSSRLAVPKIMKPVRENKDGSPVPSSLTQKNSKCPLCQAVQVHSVEARLTSPQGSLIPRRSDGNCDLTTTQGGSLIAKQNHVLLSVATVLLLPATTEGTQMREEWDRQTNKVIIMQGNRKVEISEWWIQPGSGIGCSQKTQNTSYVLTERRYRNSLNWYVERRN